MSDEEFERWCATFVMPEPAETIGDYRARFSIINGWLEIVPEDWEESPATIEEYDAPSPGIDEATIADLDAASAANPELDGGA